MKTENTFWAAQGAMATFVLLWGSAAIVTRWGLDHGSVLALLILRFALALGALLLIRGGRLLPPRGQRLPVAGVGLLLIGFYTLCYFLALEHEVTPGLLATVLGAQPILTLVLTERRFAPWRLAGLLLALLGLTLVVYQSLVLARLSWTGMAFALGALLCVTVGALWQKRIALPPSEVLPLQYAVTLLLCALLIPFQPFHWQWSLGFLVPVVWMGLGVSVVAQLLFYRMIRSGNLVNVTSLFYLVPVVTVLLDYLVFGNAPSVMSLAGMTAILAGLAVVHGQRERVPAG